jgi:hypothetical protein
LPGCLFETAFFCPQAPGDGDQDQHSESDQDPPDAVQLIEDRPMPYPLHEGIEELRHVRRYRQKNR